MESRGVVDSLFGVPHGTFATHLFANSSFSNRQLLTGRLYQRGGCERTLRCAEESVNDHPGTPI
jgi:hypothetical protein